MTTEYDIVGATREQMVFDKEKLLEVFDATVGTKPRKDPKITGYDNSGLAARHQAERAAAHAAIRFGSFDAAHPVFRFEVESALRVYWENVGQPDTPAVRERWPER